jgi:uncharacterized MAPEG superfamily protein
MDTPRTNLSESIMNYVAISAVLGVIYILTAAFGANTQRSFKWNLGPRDEPQPPLTGVPARLDRASKNFLESYPIFLGAVLGSSLMNKPISEIETGMALYIWGRAAYLPLYAFGVPVVRTLAWIVSGVGIIMIIAKALIA